MTYVVCRCCSVDLLLMVHGRVAVDPSALALLTSPDAHRLFNMALDLVCPPLDSLSPTCAATLAELTLNIAKQDPTLTARLKARLLALYQFDQLTPHLFLAIQPFATPAAKNTSAANPIEKQFVQLMVPHLTQTIANGTRTFYF